MQASPCVGDEPLPESHGHLAKVFALSGDVLSPGRNNVWIAIVPSWLAHYKKIMLHILPTPMIANLNKKNTPGKEQYSGHPLLERHFRNVTSADMMDHIAYRLVGDPKEAFDDCLRWDGNRRHDCASDDPMQQDCLKTQGQTISHTTD